MSLSRVSAVFSGPGLGRWLRLGAVVVAVSLAGALLWWQAAPDRVAVLIIEENNGSILSGRPEQATVPRLSLAGQAAGGTEPTAVYLDPALVPLPRRTRFLVYQTVTSGLDLVEDRLWLFTALPASVETGSAAVLKPDNAGGAEQVNLVQNERRLGLPAVEVAGLAADGLLTLRLSGQNVRLRQGEQWVAGRVVESGTEQAIPGDTWDTAVRAAITNGQQLTVVRITYLGLLPRGRLRPFGERGGEE
ncbi:MAG: hypothetical protein ACYC5Y_00555 [Symbiobacteriia bacterium]